MIATKSIEREELGVYVVVLERDDSTRSFKFRVDPGDIHVVACGADFEDYMKMQGFRAHPLFKAVLALHNAQHIDVPED